MTQTTLREYLRTIEDAISSGRINEAMTNCQNILSYFPEALEAQHLLGEVYLAQGQLEEAQQTFEWILTNDPENVIVYCDRALISERTSDIDTALDCYQQAYELSRGNANIRQEFNQLSARAGQQEFMFSRAGLARLYMRGNLLTQAIQEWEAVLAITPERLDARLGLIETYWREGLFDKAEQFATQLLEEIPTCLKALLYLAHITSISNIARAKDLLLRAETLDPELRMAQEVFADLASSQPNDPFLVLIQKEPILLEEGIPVNRPIVRTPIEQQQPAPTQSAASAPSQSWNALPQAIPPVSPLPEASSGTNRNASPETPWMHNQNQPELLSWQEQLAPTTQAGQPWYESDQYAATNVPKAQNWETLANDNQTLHNWNSEVQEEEQPAPPAWLGTLTKSEPPQVLAPAYQTPSTPSSLAETHPVMQPLAQEDEPMPFFFPSENAENEGEMGWPAWLKSLGAESLEPEEVSEPLVQSAPIPAAPAWHDPYTSQPTHEANPWDALPAASVNQAKQPEAASQPDWMQQLATPANEPSQNAIPDWMQQFASSESLSQPQTTLPAPLNEQEQHYITSLEDLEKSLQAQGFAPLTPGTLASIAQANISAPTQLQEQPSLSSALAQLGNFAQSPITQATSAASNDPWWNTMLSQTPEQTTLTPSSVLSEQITPYASLSAHAHQEVIPPLPLLPATPMPLATAPFQPSTGQIPAMSAPLVPTYRSDALLESDLETTMKRPAIKLQPMQVGSSSERFYANGKGHGHERPSIGQSNENSLSNHERLVRGYQYQLSGAYDEAMNDYRLITKNAPELLDDVISNMRALLKLNPRFSQGYRVLGDAYMKKGEYLQAMESYNKALTMAKKAKS